MLSVHARQEPASAPAESPPSPLSQLVTYAPVTRAHEAATEAQREWLRCRPLISRAIEADPENSHTIEQVEEMIETGRALFTSNGAAALVICLVTEPEGETAQVLYAGGGDNDLATLIDVRVEYFAKFFGCVGVVVYLTPAQEKPLGKLLKAGGYRTTDRAGLMVKNLGATK